MDKKAQTDSQPQPSSEADVRDLGTAPGGAGAESTSAEPQFATPLPQISILGLEPQEVEFLKFDLSAVEGKSELEKRRHADSMDLPALGNFIRQGLHGLKRLVEAYRPYIENFMERTAHQGEQRMLKNKKGEPASREEVVREQLGVGVRRVNQLLAATGPEPLKSSRSHLTQTQDEVVQALVAQGFAKKDAVVMTKAATGEDFDTLFRSALSRGLGNPPAPPNSSAPAPHDPAPVVVAESPVQIDQSSEEKLDDEAESGDPPPPVAEAPVVEPSVVGGEESTPTIPADAQIEEEESGDEAATPICSPKSADPQIAELKKEIADLQNEAKRKEEETAVLSEESAALRAENENLQRRIEAISSVPEHLRDGDITSRLAAEPDSFKAGEILRIYLHGISERVLPPNMGLGVLSVTVRMVGRSSRITGGDYVEKQNKNPQPPTLCRCVPELSEAGRRKVSEWREEGWGKPYVIYSNDEINYRVITREVAKKITPEAFEPTEKSPVGL